MRRTIRFSGWWGYTRLHSRVVLVLVVHVEGSVAAVEESNGAGQSGDKVASYLTIHVAPEVVPAYVIERHFYEQRAQMELERKATQTGHT